MGSDERATDELAAVDNPATHCFREDNCVMHEDHQGDECCCCGQPANVHEGCDCD